MQPVSKCFKIKDPSHLGFYYINVQISYLLVESSLVSFVFIGPQSSVKLPVVMCFLLTQFHNACTFLHMVFNMAAHSLFNAIRSSLQSPGKSFTLPKVHLVRKQTSACHLSIQLKALNHKQLQRSSHIRYKHSCAVVWFFLKFHPLVIIHLYIQRGIIIICLTHIGVKNMFHIRFFGICFCMK